MNKISKNTLQTVHYATEKKPKIQNYPLQDDRDSDRPFDKIAIDLVTECETSTSGNQHILTIIDHLTGWPEAFPIPDKSVDTIVSTFINEYLPVYMCPRYILSDNGTEFKKQPHGSSLKAIRYWQDIFSTMPPTEQWQIESFPQIFKTNLEEAPWQGPVQLG